MTIAADVPEQVAYGRVVHRLVRTLAESADGEAKGEIPHTGSVILTRLRESSWPEADPPRTAPVEEHVCPVIAGDIYPPGTTEDDLPAIPGVVAVASESGTPGSPWQARYRLDDVVRQPATRVFNVPAGGVVDLAKIVPPSPGPGIIPVVDHEDRIAAEAAAKAAGGHAEAAAGSVAASEAARDDAAKHARAASSSEAAASGHEEAAAGHAADARASATAADAAQGVAATAASTATDAATQAATSAGAAVDAARSAAESDQSASASAASAAESQQVASQGATTATDAAEDARTSRDQAATSALSAAESAQRAADEAASVRGLRIFLVPHDQWPPAPDPDPLHWYVRVREESPAPASTALPALDLLGRAVHAPEDEDAQAPVDDGLPTLDYLSREVPAPEDEEAS